jgi:hypothetical protein
MLPYPESTLQPCPSRRFCEVWKQVYFGSLLAVRTTCLFHPDTHQCLEAHQSSRRSQCSSASVWMTWLYHSDAIQGLTNIRVSASRNSYRKTAATVWTMCYSVRTMFSIRQDVHQFNTCSRDAVNRDSTFRVMSRLEDSQVPCQPSGRCVIPSGRQTVQHHPSGRRASSIRTLHCIERLLCQLAPSERLSVLERFTDSFQVPRKGRSINRPDAYLRKARIAVQNEPSGHLTAVVRTLVHRIW